ncbi:hypothetical protein PR048_016131 [Dryococelus australis]|uniref:Retroviral polymerase SH3-like domain-containing protein n=1 Tax=Dryococelus australis TaxID=614101 RepID=A0ABQ9HJ96_9NEOP|nr:hypothetical protein PR048_016131 [Dryococelus australis]
MRTYLEHEELWQCVTGKEKDDKKVTRARAEIILSIGSVNYVHVQDTNTAKEAWNKTLITTTLESCASVDEYINIELLMTLRELGIQPQTTCLHTPEKNDLAERLNCTLMEKALSLNTAAYLHNRSPSRVLAGKTPEEVWSGHKPDLRHLRVFGCKAFAHIPRQTRRRFNEKGEECIFVGYCENSKGYRLLMQGTTRVIKSHDVVFVENEATHSETKKGVRKSPNPTTSLQITEDTSTPIINDVEDDTHHKTDSPSQKPSKMEDFITYKVEADSADPQTLEKALACSAANIGFMPWRKNLIH